MTGGPELAAGRRPNWFEGRLLTAADLAAEQDYLVSRRHLHNRTVLGDGVVAGLGVEPSGSGVVVRPGVALDGWGREIVVPADVEVAPPGPGDYAVELRYREERVDPTPGGDAAAVLEGYHVDLRDGAAPARAPKAPAGVIEALRAGDLRSAVCRLAASLAEEADAGDDPVVVLANVAVAADGAVAVDDCGPRRVVPTNRLLARLVAALADAGSPAP